MGGVNAGINCQSSKIVSQGAPLFSIPSDVPRDFRDAVRAMIGRIF